MLWKEKYKKEIVFIVTTAIMIVFAFLMASNSEKKIEPKKTAVIDEFYKSEEVELALFYNLSSKVENAADIFVHWWKQPESSKYYFFLPQGLKEKEIYWIFSDEIDVFIDHEVIEEYTKFNLEEGSHALRIEQDGVKNEYTLEVAYSSVIATLFLETTYFDIMYYSLEF